MHTTTELTPPKSSFFLACSQSGSTCRWHAYFPVYHHIWEPEASLLSAVARRRNLFIVYHHRPETPPLIEEFTKSRKWVQIVCRDFFAPCPFAPIEFAPKKKKKCYKVGANIYYKHTPNKLSVKSPPSTTNWVHTNHNKCNAARRSSTGYATNSPLLLHPSLSCYRRRKKEFSLPFPPNQQKEAQIYKEFVCGSC